MIYPVLEVRGLVNRFAPGPVFALSPTVILIAVDGLFTLVLAVLLSVW